MMVRLAPMWAIPLNLGSVSSDMLAPDLQMAEASQSQKHAPPDGLKPIMGTVQGILMAKCTRMCFEAFRHAEFCLPRLKRKRHDNHQWVNGLRDFAALRT